MRPDDGPGAGDTFFIYDPERDLPDNRQMPFATIVTKDYGDFDNLSKLDRDGVYRLNIGVSRETFRSLFPTDTEHDFAASDTLMPHPVYAPQSWVSVLNPSEPTFESASRYLPRRTSARLVGSTSATAADTTPPAPGQTRCARGMTPRTERPRTAQAA